MKKLVVILLALAITFTIGSCKGGNLPASEQKNPAMPADLGAFVNEEMEAIGEIGESISGTWGDKHVYLTETFDGSKFDNSLYDELKLILDEYRMAKGAYSLYTLMPNENNDYLITIDDSQEPDNFMTNYGNEIQFDEAWAGKTSTARSGWDDDVPCWSCFAPVYNSAGDVVCIIGIDLPCELLKEYPEWNRDRQEWNGIRE